MALYLLTWLLILLAGTGATAAVLGWPRQAFTIALNIGAGSILGLLLAGALAEVVGGQSGDDVLTRALPALALITALSWYAAWRWQPTNVAALANHRQKKRLWVVGALLVLLISLRLLPLCNEVLLRPVFPWDAWALWMVKPKAWFLGGHIDRYVDPVSWFAMGDGVRTLAGSNYPELSGRLQLLLASAVGEWNEPLLMLPWMVMYIALLLAFAGVSRRLGCSPLAALSGCYALASLPLLNAQVALAGYLDVWVGAVLMLAVGTWLLWRRERRLVLLLLALALGCSLILLKREGAVWFFLLLSIIALDGLSPHWQRRAAWTGAVGVVVFAVIAIGFGSWIDGLIEQWKLPGVSKLSLAWRPGGLVFVTALFTHGNWHLLGLLLVGLPLLRWRQFRKDAEVRLLGLLVLIAWIALLVLFCLTPAAEWAVRQTATNRLVLQLVPVMLLWLTLLVRGWDPLQVDAISRSRAA